MQPLTNVWSVIICGSSLFLLSCGRKSVVLDGIPGSLKKSSTTATATPGGYGVYSVDILSPGFSSDLSVSEIGSTGFKINWERGSDLSTAQKEIEYRVVYTNDGALINATCANEILPSGVFLLKDWKKDLTQASFVGLLPKTAYKIAILMRDKANNIAILGPRKIVTNSVGAPTTGSVPVFAKTTNSAVELAWGAATDGISGTTKLEYRVVRAASAAKIDEIEKIVSSLDSEVTLVKDWTSDLTKLRVEGLTSGSSNYFAIVVRDNENNYSMYPPNSMQTSSGAISVSQTAGQATDSTLSYVTNSESSPLKATITWPAAISSSNPNEVFKYKLVKAASKTSIDSIAEIEAFTGDDVLENWTENILSKEIVGLRDDIPSYFGILVKDSLGNIAIYDPITYIPTFSSSPSPSSVISAIVVPVVRVQALTNNQSPTWTWSSGGDGVGIFRYKIDDPDLSSGAIITTGLSYTSGILTSGEHSFYVQERDDKGVWSASVVKKVVIDTTGPTVLSFVVANGAADAYINIAESAIGLPLATITALDYVSVKYALISGSVSLCTGLENYTYFQIPNAGDVGLVNGQTYKLCAKLTDDAANIAYASPTDSFVIDKVSPSVGITTSANAYIDNNSISFVVAGTCSEAAKLVTIKIDDVTNGSGSLCDGVNFSATVNTVGLSDGLHSLSADITDNAGNLASSVVVASKEITALTAAATNTTTLGLSWISGGGNSVGYKVSYLAGAIAPATCAAGILLPNGQISATTATITGLTAGTQYSFRVCALDTNSTPNVSTGITVSGTTLQLPPLNVTSPTATASSDTVINMSWVSGGGSTSGYKVSYLSGATPPASCALGTEVPQGQISGTTASVTGLTSSTHYSFRVCAINANPTPDVTSGTPIDEFTLPSVPAGVYLSFPYSKSMKLHFNNVASAINYKAYYKASAGVTVTDNPLGSVSDGYVITGLNSTGTYYVRISAVDANNKESNLSAEVSLLLPEFITLPNNLASYTSIGSAYVYGVYGSGSDIYASTNNGLSISNDGGTTWVSKTTANGLGTNVVNDVYVSGNTIYAATVNGGLSISADRGATWTSKTTANGLGHNVVQSVYVSGSNIYASTSGGLSISTDSGATFTNKTTANGLGSNVVLSVYVSGSNIYAATNGGLSISTDSGANFVNKTTVDGLGNNIVNKVYESGGSIYASTSGGLGISTDFGATFINKTSANGLAHTFIYDIYVSGTDVYAGTGLGLSISTDSGSTWNTKTTANGLVSNMVSKVNGSGSNIYVSSNGYGLSISTNSGASFIAKTTSQGLVGANIFGFSVSGSNVYVATNEGLKISADSGATWTTKTTANGLGNNYVDGGVYTVGSNIYAGTNGGLSISTDSGATFGNKTTVAGLGSNSVKNVFVSGANIYAATSAGLSLSTDNGVSFANKTTTEGLGSNTVNSVYAAGVNIYAATAAGLSISTDSGATFTNKTTTNGLGSNTVNYVYAVGSSVYAATAAGLSISTDNGAIFTNKTISNGLGSNSINCVYVDGGTIYAATQLGLSRSTDSGVTFTNKTTSSGLVNIRVNRVYATGSYIYATGNQFGLAVSGL